ncbi:hypothetical protein [Alkalibacillus almallahensis]|uniref:hypothetical protein n=1 Tax=Alkalibacillus almallahensis TaxID=1379154 RepID=UPI00141FC6C6|nr:hypothetical protein [Alkalibacillus almallahensis]NIK12807.1 hypothetical protein [Alkalibacillus almallahensis]
MAEVKGNEMLSRLFTLLIGIMIFVMLNMNGEVFHPLMTGEVMEFFIILLLVCGTMYMAVFIGDLVSKTKYNKIIQSVGSITIAIYLVYLLMT